MAWTPVFQMDPRGVEAPPEGRCPPISSRFQMDPRGVEARVGNAREGLMRRFQMDPRGVEASSIGSPTSTMSSFRWTLVGLKPGVLPICLPTPRVSDGPSWG